MIQDTIEIGGQVTSPLKGSTAHEDSRLEQDIESQQVLEVILGIGMPVEKLEISIHHNTIAVDHTDLRMVLKDMHSMGNHIRGVIEIIRVEPGDNITAGMHESLIDCLRLTGVLLGDPPCQPFSIFIDDFNTPII